MSTPQAINRRFILARRPQGEPSVDDFLLEKQPVPAAGPAGRQGSTDAASAPLRGRTEARAGLGRGRALAIFPR